jgi:glycerol-3-phosphate O-acyltransferase
MPEVDLVRQLELYRRLARAAPYSSDVWCTPLSGEDIVAYGRSLGLVETVPNDLGAIVRMSESHVVTSAYYRNNILHLFALPSLIACAFMNNEAVREEDLQRLMARIYPYVAQELFLHWPESQVPMVVAQLLEALAAQGMLSRSDDGLWWHRPATASAEGVQLSRLAQAMLEVVERYYLAIALLLQSGSGRMTQDMLEQRCQQAASRMAVLYELHSPEFFDRDLFRQFCTLLRDRGLLGLDGEGCITFDSALADVARDARFVLSAQIQHSVLQVTHS